MLIYSERSSQADAAGANRVMEKQNCIQGLTISETNLDR